MLHKVTQRLMCLNTMVVIDSKCHFQDKFSVFIVQGVEMLRKSYKVENTIKYKFFKNIYCI